MRHAASQLPPLSAIHCEKCGGPARLLASRLDRLHETVKETLTYECEACGAQMTRVVISR